MKNLNKLSLVFVDEKYINSDAGNLIHHICSLPGSFYGMYGILPFTPEAACNCMLDTCKQQHLSPQTLLHYFYIRDIPFKDLPEAYLYASEISSLLSIRYQVVFSVQPSFSESFCIHFAVASVSYLPNAHELTTSELDDYCRLIIGYSRSRGIMIREHLIANSLEVHQNEN